MTVWRPQPSPLRFVLPLLVLLCAIAALLLWSRLAQEAALAELSPHALLLGLAFSLVLLLGGMLAYMTWCVLTMRYVLEGEYLGIVAGGVTHVVPVSSITAVHPPGDSVKGTSIAVRWRGYAAALPGYVVGGGTSPQVGRVVSVATVPPAGQVFVRTHGVSLGLSPQDPANFIVELKRRQESVPLPLLDGDDSGPGAHTVLTGPSAWWAPLWSDRLARFFFVSSLALNVLLLGYLSLVYANLPSPLPLHWNSQAQVDYVGDARELLRLPVFALAIWLVNAVAAWLALRRERAVTLFLLAGSAAAQLVFLAGAASIALRAA